MAGDLVRFVDSIAASPTVRLNVNDEVTWWVKSFSAPPPRLRRSMSSNAMRDGAHMSASNYEPRTVTLELEVRTSTQDATATAMQTLWRELDRESNYLMYQPTGATKPVFFRLYRSDASQVEDVRGQAAMRTITVDLLAEPFFLGLRETLGPYTVNNDPAHASNPCYFDVTGVLGDVPAPAVVVVDPSVDLRTFYLTRGANRGFFQAETPGGSTDTTNPGGGPDAAMSGTGTNNYLRTSFATVPTMTARISYAFSVTVGAYRVLVAVRRSDATSVIRVALAQNDAEVTLPLTTSRQLVDLGIYSTPEPLGFVGHSPVSNGTSVSIGVDLEAARDSGAGTLDWDYVLLIPADEMSMIATFDASCSGVVIDGISEEVKAWLSSLGGDPILGTASPAPPIGVSISGSSPSLTPAATTRLHFLQSGLLGAHDKTRTASITVHHWPRYLHVRPSAS